jgi:hypothetical protein
MKLALFYNLKFTKMYTNLEKYILHYLNFMSCLFEFIRVEGLEVLEIF